MNDECVVIKKSIKQVDAEAYIKQLFRFTIGDVSYLLRDSKIPPLAQKGAGPILMVTMNAIAAMSGVLYGFDIDEGDRFAKFMVEHMETPKNVAAYLYHACRMGLIRMGMPRSNMFYGFSFKAKEIAGGWGINNEFVDGYFLAIEGEDILLRVDLLAEKYLKTARELEKKFESNPSDFPAKEFELECEKGRAFLDAASEELKKMEMNKGG